TRKAAVARAALAAGAAVVNDVSGLAFDAALAGVVGAAGAGMIVMHMRGTPDTMDSLAVYRHVAADVAAELGAAAARAEAGGGGWPQRRRVQLEPRSRPVPHPPVLAGRGRDPSRRDRDLPVPAVPGRDAGDVHRRGRDDPVDRLLRGPARQVHHDQRAALLRVHLRRVRGRRRVPAGAPERPGAARPVAPDASLLLDRA